MDRCPIARFGGKSKHNTVTHANHNLIVSVDVETTGLKCGHHEVCQIAIVPLDSDFKPSAMPFYMNIAPQFPERCDPEATKVHKLKPSWLILNGTDRWASVDLFERWFEKLELPEGKKLMPLGHNYAKFDMPFIQEWLGGPLGYDTYFHWHIRDSLSCALFLNDRLDSRNERPPCPKVSLDYLCSIYREVNDKPHDALQDAVVTAKIYRHLLREMA